MIDTKSRILDAAERLFAEHGPDVSLRSITAQAGVNLAAVNYHFQSKDALFEALLERRFEPINQARLRALNELELECPSGPLPLERVLDAFLGPILDFAGQDPDHYRPLMGRMFSMPDEYARLLFERHIAPVMARFRIAFARALPGLRDPDLTWCMIFCVGVMVQPMVVSKVLPVVGLRLRDSALREHVLRFAAAGMRAAALEGDSA